MRKSTLCSFYNSIFSSEATSEKLCEITKIKKFAKGDVIYIPGDIAGDIYFVVKGIISLLRVTPNGRGVFLDFIDQNRFFGDEVLLPENNGRMELAEVKKDVQLAVINADDFKNLSYRDPVVSKFLIEQITLQSRQLTDRLEILLHREVKVRLAALLMELSKTHGTIGKKGVVLNLNIPHHELARFIGATRETVSATISSLKNEGTLSSNGRKLIITDMDALECLI
ncbi:MAG: Crp/Fnr family transcriptional regulator [Deltaproteobacteria bacterium]|nr:Crp/Fnr family transcriptional regulator [Deltaproteobacteria bacterium]